jgi:transposase
MEKRKSSVRYAHEVRERAVRMMLEHAGDRASQGEAIGSIAAKIGCTAETLRKRVRQAERERGMGAGPTSAEQTRIKAL